MLMHILFGYPVRFRYVNEIQAKDLRNRQAVVGERDLWVVLGSACCVLRCYLLCVTAVTLLCIGEICCFVLRW